MTGSLLLKVSQTVGLQAGSNQTAIVHLSLLQPDAIAASKTYRPIALQMVSPHAEPKEHHEA
jgi:hypothetical protein